MCHNLFCIMVPRAPEVVVSDSAGRLTLLGLKQGSCDMEELLQWPGHQYEAWIVAFNKWIPNVIYSGKMSLVNVFCQILTFSVHSNFDSQKQYRICIQIKTNP